MRRVGSSNSIGELEIDEAFGLVAALRHFLGGTFETGPIRGELLILADLTLISLLFEVNNLLFIP